jgi:hypothetical protein
MNFRLDRDPDDNEIVLLPFDPAPAMRAVFAHRQNDRIQARLAAARAIEELEWLRLSVGLCLWVERLAGEGFTVSSDLLGDPLLAAEVNTWTGVGVDKLIRLQSAA